jgi:hypothetical protein
VLEKALPPGGGKKAYKRMLLPLSGERLDEKARHLSRKSRMLGTCDDTKQGANSLGLQVQSVVARVNFPHEKTRGLYRTLGEQLKKLSSFFFKQPTTQFPCLVSSSPPSGCQAQGVNISKINMICNKINNNAIK